MSETIIESNDKHLIDISCNTTRIDYLCFLPSYDDIDNVFPAEKGSLAYDEDTEEIQVSNGMIWSSVGGILANCIENTAGTTKACANDDDTITLQTDGFTSDVAILHPNGAFQIGRAVATGAGSIANGNEYDVVANGRGSSITAHSLTGGICEANGDGSMLVGYNDAGGSTSTMRVTGQGSLLSGQCETSGGNTSNIINNAKGSLLVGANCINSTMTITSDAYGSLLTGRISSTTQFIEVRGRGSLVTGKVGNTGSSGDIIDNGNGSLIITHDFQGDITNNGDGCILTGYYLEEFSSVDLNGCGNLLMCQFDNLSDPSDSFALIESSCSGNMLLGYGRDTSNQFRINSNSKGNLMFGYVDGINVKYTIENNVTGSMAFGYSREEDSQIIIKENTHGAVVFGTFQDTDTGTIIHAGSSDTSEIIYGPFVRGHADIGLFGTVGILSARGHGSFTSGRLEGFINDIFETTGEGSHGFGTNLKIDGDFSCGFGFASHARNTAQFVLGQTSDFAVGSPDIQGNAQCSKYIIRNASSGFGTVELFIDGNTESERILVPSDASFLFCSYITARGDCNGTDLDAGYRIDGIIEHNSTSDISSILSSTKTILYETPAFASEIDINVSANFNSLQFIATSTSDCNIRWTACVKTTEVLFER